MRIRWVLGAMAMVGCGPAVAIESDGGEAGDTEPADPGSGAPGEPTSASVTSGAPPSTAGPVSDTEASATTSGAGSMDGGSGPDSSTTETAPPWVEDARDRYPTFRALYEGYLRGSCSAFQDVCHRNREFPELAEAEDYLAVFDVDCREVGDPDYDGCEPLGSQVLLVDGPDFGWTSELAWRGFEDDTIQLATRTPAPSGGPVTVAVATADADVWVEISGAIAEDGLFIAPLDGLSDADQEVLATEASEGDPNRNGIFGADMPDHVLTAGDPDSSLIVLGMRGLVPGLVIPLANQPPELAELGALGCWVEQVLRPNLAALDEPIDYDACTFELP